MSKVLTAFCRRYTPEIVMVAMNYCAWAILFHYMRGISWAGSFVLALFVLVVGAALGTLLVNLLDRTRY